MRFKVHSSVVRFNSNMVRLRANVRHRFAMLLYSFNSNMVRLRALLLTALTIPQLRFNSNMVRLRDCNIMNFNEILVVSIPIWCD